MNSLWVLGGCWLASRWAACHWAWRLASTQGLHTANRYVTCVQHESDEQYCSFLSNGCRTFRAVDLCQLLQVACSSWHLSWSAVMSWRIHCMPVSQAKHTRYVYSVYSSVKPMKIQIDVCGHAWPIKLASGWVSWDLGMSDFLICLSFVFPLCPCGHTLVQSCEDGLWPICWHAVAWDAHWKQIWLLYLPSLTLQFFSL